MSAFKDLKQAFGGRGGGGHQIGILIVLVAIVIFFNIWTGGLTLSPNNLIAVVSQYSYILILAVGMVLVIIGTHIDLSVGSVAAFTGIIVAMLMNNYHIPWWAAIIAGLLVGALIGAWQGFWVAYVGVPAFIVTLAGMLIFRGGNQFIGSANTIPVPPSFQVIGAGYLPEIGPNTGFNNLTMLLGIAVIVALIILEFRRRRVQQRLGADVAPFWAVLVKLVIIGGLIGYAAYLFATGRVGTSFPVSGIILLGLALAYSFFTNNTVAGRHVYAVGGNVRAAELSGINSRRTNFFIMMNMSTLAALAGMIFVARSNASGPQDGLNWELDAISAVFIGGAAVAGGVGTVTGSLIGGSIMAFLNNGLQLMGVTSDRVQIIKGLVLLLAVGFDVYNKKQGRPSITGLIAKGLRRGRTAAHSDGSGALAAPVDSTFGDLREPQPTPNSADAASENTTSQQTVRR